MIYHYNPLPTTIILYQILTDTTNPLTMSTTISTPNKSVPSTPYKLVTPKFPDHPANGHPCITFDTKEVTTPMWGYRDLNIRVKESRPLSEWEKLFCTDNIIIYTEKMRTDGAGMAINNNIPDALYIKEFQLVYDYNSPY